LSRRSAAGTQADAPLRDLPLRESGPVETPHDVAPAPASRGVMIWFVAAASLIVGIVIGFTSGYSAARRAAEPVVLETETGTATAGEAFSEADVAEPERIEPEPIVVPEEPDRADRSVRSNRADRSPVQNDANANVSNLPNAPNVSNDRRPGSIDVVSRPAGAQVIVDGRVMGRTPLSVPNLTPGQHSVRLELPGYNRWATSVDVAAGARARVAASLEQP
jgi:hypothetical protein